MTLSPDENEQRQQEAVLPLRRGRLPLDPLGDVATSNFMNWMKYRHPHVRHKWTSDYVQSAIASPTRIGVYVFINRGGACCSNYNRSNRSKRYIINNIECVEEEVKSRLAWSEFVKYFLFLPLYLLALY
jgi:hypothetical protein